jgi:AcrR family transcriptional regulator
VNDDRHQQSETMDSSRATGILPVKGRRARQTRSVETQIRISAAAVDLLSELGISGITHRLVAERASVPLAATTYHFATKSDIVASASNLVLERFKKIFSAVADDCRSGASRSISTKQLVVRTLQRVATEDGVAVRALFEILLESVRHPESFKFAEQLIKEIGLLLSAAQSSNASIVSAESATDILMGFLFLTSSLKLSSDQIGSVLLNGRDPLKGWAATSAKETVETLISDPRDNGNKTRRRILDEAINILIAEGASALSYKLIASRIGVSAATPSYHFTSVVDLLRSAQVVLFEASQRRYHSLVTATNFRTIDLGQFIELTSVVFQREATEFGRFNLATFSLWLEAARRAELRPLIWSAVVRHCQSSAKLIENYTSNFRVVDGLLYHVMFFGKLMRILSTGASNLDLMRVRQEFARDIEAAVRGEHWLLLPS